MKKIFTVLILFTGFLVPSLAFADAADLQNEPIPKEFIKVKIPYGVSSIDLRGKGKADDWAIRGSKASMMDTFSFLTKAENDPDQKYHSVRTPGEEGNSIQASDGDPGVNCSGQHTFFLRDVTNLKQFYFVTTSRSAYMEPNIGVKFKISLYRLYPADGMGILIGNHPINSSDNIWYTFHLVRQINVPPKNFSLPKCVDHPEICGADAACSADSIEKLEESVLKIKVRG